MSKALSVTYGFNIVNLTAISNAVSDKLFHFEKSRDHFLFYMFSMDFLQLNTEIQSRYTAGKVSREKAK
jgi:hypothetical protein